MDEHNFSCTILTDTFKQALSSVLPVTEEGRIVVDETGIRISAADQANIGMVNIYIGKTLFTQYVYPPELGSKSESISIGADFVKLYQMVQVINDPLIELKFDNAKIYMKAGGYDYTLAQLDTSTLKPDPKVPSLEFPVNLTIPTSELQDAFKAASKLQTDSVTLGVHDKAFHMLVDNEIGDTLEFSLGADVAIGLEDATKDTSSKYNLQYLARMMKGIGHAQAVMLRLRSDYPLMVEVSLGPKDSFVNYMIAPRIMEAKK
jgi:proliferating cell nuclear antigen